MAQELHFMLTIELILDEPFQILQKKLKSPLYAITQGFHTTKYASAVEKFRL